MRVQQTMTISLVLLLKRTAGQTSTLSVPFMGFNFEGVDASVVTVQAGITTLALNCPPGSGSTNCGIYATETVITGPSTYSLVLTDPTALSFTQACVPSGTSPFSTYSCHESAQGTKVQDGPSSSTTIHTDDVTYVPITVTAGANLLNGAAATGVTPTSATSSAATSIGTTATGAAACSTSGQITECSNNGGSTAISASSAASTGPSTAAVSTASAGSSTVSGSSNAAAAIASLGLNKVLGLLTFPLLLI